MNTKKKLHICTVLGEDSRLHYRREIRCILALMRRGLVPEVQTLPLVIPGHLPPHCIWYCRRHLHQWRQWHSLCSLGDKLYLSAREGDYNLGCLIIFTVFSVEQMLSFVSYIYVVTFAFLAVFIFDQWSRSQSQWPIRVIDCKRKYADSLLIGVSSAPSHRQMRRQTQSWASVVLQGLCALSVHS